MNGVFKVNPITGALEYSAGGQERPFSHIGQIIESTTLDTEAKVKAIYGDDTHWISHSGYVLRGATSGVVANSANKTGGNDTQDYTPAGSNSGGSVSGHALTKTEIPSDFTRSFYHADTSTWSLGSWGAHGGNYSVTMAGQTGYTDGWNGSHSHGFTNPTFKGTKATIVTLPSYKSVYIWERVS